MLSNNNQVEKKSTNKSFIKWVKLAHVFFTITWLGYLIVLAFLIFFKPELTSGDALHYLNSIIYRIDNSLMIVAPIGSLLTGIMLSKKMKKGLLTHWWIIIKLVLTVAIILISIIFLAPASTGLFEISGKLGLAALTDETYMSYFTRLSILNPINIFLLLFMMYLAYFKPWGKRTPKQKD